MLELNKIDNKTLNDFLESIKDLHDRTKEQPSLFNNELNDEFYEVYNILKLIKQQNPTINLRYEAIKLVDNPNLTKNIVYFTHNNRAIFGIKYNEKFYLPHYNVLFLAISFLEDNIDAKYVKLEACKKNKEDVLYIKVLSPNLRKKNHYYLLNGKYKVDNYGKLLSRPKDKVLKMLNPVYL